MKSLTRLGVLIRSVIYYYYRCARMTHFIDMQIVPNVRTVSKQCLQRASGYRAEQISLTRCDYNILEIFCKYIYV